MNERIIKEMSKQAHLVADATYAEGPDSVWLKEYNKKFAELIVKECLDQCYNRGMNDALYAGQLKAAAYIEEHFGVSV
jgi:hypothetical protein